MRFTNNGHGKIPILVLYLHSLGAGGGGAFGSVVGWGTMQQDGKSR
jgi:hypothetical protein